ncbi:MAG: class IV adenylate cyclase [Pseudomonadota bacterium]
MQNIEIKAHYPNINKGRKIAEELNAKYIGCDHQIDTYFRTNNGKLKLRESSLSGAVLVPYVRESKTGAKSSLYALIEVDDAKTTKELFSSIFGMDTVVEKMRHIYLIDNVRVHFDEVQGLGCFFELEAVCSGTSVLDEEHQKVDKLLKVFQVDESSLIKGSYQEMRRNSAK